MLLFFSPLHVFGSVPREKQIAESPQRSNEEIFPFVTSPNSNFWLVHGDLVASFRKVLLPEQQPLHYATASLLIE